MVMTIVEAARAITGGVDTHLDVHVAAALDGVGALLGTEAFPTTPAGYQALLSWLESHGEVTKVGVEGTGSYGAGLSKFLTRAGISVVDVNRPNREERRRSGKSDPLDAIEAARSALSGKAKSIAKSKDGAVEAIRTLVVAKRSARVARTAALTQMRHLIVSAPDQLRSRLHGLNVHHLTTEAARLRPSRHGEPVLAATKAALSSLAHRVQGLDDSWPSSTAASRHSSRLCVRTCSGSSASGPTPQRPSWSAPGTTPNVCALSLHGPACAAWPPFPRAQARPRGGSASTLPVIARPTPRYGASSWCALRTIPRPRRTSCAR